MRYYTKDQVINRNQELWQLEKQAKKIRKKMYNQKQMRKCEGINFNGCEEKIKIELAKINHMLQDIRKEKKVTYEIMKEIEKKKCIQKELSKK